MCSADPLPDVYRQIGRQQVDGLPAAGGLAGEIQTVVVGAADGVGAQVTAVAAAAPAFGVHAGAAAATDDVGDAVIVAQLLRAGKAPDGVGVGRQLLLRQGTLRLTAGGSGGVGRACRRITGSRPSRGSSRISTSGRVLMASWKAACFCMPLENRRMGLFLGS